MRAAISILGLAIGLQLHLGLPTSLFPILRLGRLPPLSIATSAPPPLVTPAPATPFTATASPLATPRPAPPPAARPLRLLPHLIRQLAQPLSHARVLGRPALDLVHLHRDQLLRNPIGRVLGGVQTLPRALP